MLNIVFNDAISPLFPDGEPMCNFVVTVRTDGRPTQYTALAQTSAEAFDQAATRFADVACGITVMPERVPA